MKFFGAHAVQKSQSAQSSQSEAAAQKKEENSPNGQKVTRFCTNCGSPLEADDLFCSECGSKIEQEENAVTIEEDESPQEQAPAVISSDRMASILQTNRIKTGEMEDEFRKEHPLTDTTENALHAKKSSQIGKTLQLGHYVHKTSSMTQYLIIESVQGNSVKASVKTNFTRGDYSTESYEGTLSGNDLHLHLVGSDLHPLPDERHVSFGSSRTIHYSIKLSEQFDGIVSDDTISGSFVGQFSKFVVFRKC